MPQDKLELAPFLCIEVLVLTLQFKLKSSNASSNDCVRPPGDASPRLISSGATLLLKEVVSASSESNQGPAKAPGFECMPLPKPRCPLQTDSAAGCVHTS